MVSCTVAGMRASSLHGFVDAGYGGSDTAARGEGSDDLAAARPARRHEIIQEPVYCRLVEDPFIAIRLQVQLERFELDAAIAGSVAEGDRAEIGLARLGTDAGEFGAHDFDGIVAPRIGVCESFQLI